MRLFTFVGRLMVGFFYLYPAYENIFQSSAKVGYAAAKGVLMPELLIPLSGFLLLIGGLSILTGYQPKVGVAAIWLFFVPVTLTMHNFWNIQDPMMRMVEFHSFLANLGLAGSALLFLAIPTPWAFSLNLTVRPTAVISNPRGVVTLLALGLLVAYFVMTPSAPVGKVALGMPALDAASGNVLTHACVRADYCGNGA